MNPMTNEKLSVWKNLIKEKKESNLRLKDFCQEKNIKMSQFYYYHGLINRSEKAKQAQPLVKAIHLIKPTPKDNHPIHLILPNHFQCILPRDISSHEIKTILQVLMSC